MDAERTLSSHNIAFLEALYERYEQDPESVDPSWRAFIEDARRPRDGNGAARLASNGSAGANRLSADAEQVALQSAVDRLIENYRHIGHLRAQIDPLGRRRGEVVEGLDLAYFGLSDQHLDRLFHPGTLFRADAIPLREIVGKLQRTYTRRIGVEYWQINDVEQRAWLRERMESVENEVVPSNDEQIRLLRSLAKADAVDKFLHSKFIGAKRFSVAGAESVIGLLETLIEEAGDLGVREAVLAMAHRGRLSVMMNVMGQTPHYIFSRFEGGDPYENLGAGDVKYHLGCYRHHVNRSGRNMYLALLFNPSHLEAITPVLAGRIRASQDRLPAARRNEVLGVSLHGDAAAMGQGVYAETLNLSRLPGYANEGTIRVVINNQVGFTTNPEEGRSTEYSTAVADMLNIPIFHVNGDDPEAAAHVAKLSVEFRQRFRKDVIIDLVCYRRFGHNEADEPTFTQPLMYELIKKVESVTDLYERRLLERGTVSEADIKAMKEEFDRELEAALAEVRNSTRSTARAPMHGVWENYRGGRDQDMPEVETKVSPWAIDTVGRALLTVPPGFNLHPKLKRVVEEMKEMLSGQAPLSWSAAEQLAYGTLVLEGSHVRLSGQDVVRGTFSHRHCGWTDVENGQRYFPVQHVAEGQGRFNAYNSPLSEFAVVGFEFGYTLAAPDTLVIWEAQFGDFVNGAQVIIDQFMSSSEDKWNRISGLVMFLPHGYEGQGPEHSSARLERFLQLCAEDNLQVCNLTTPGQLFHVLRRQIHRKWRKPLVIMTPKSLLRTRPSFSPRSVLTEGSFQRIIGDAEVEAAEVKTAMLCSGKVYYDLASARAERKRNDVAIIRVEQMFPFPDKLLTAELERFGKLERLLWVQEEPRNMGGWHFMRPRLEMIAGSRVQPRYVGRAPSASPATGSPESHKLEQEMILQDAFGKR